MKAAGKAALRWAIAALLVGALVAAAWPHAEALRDQVAAVRPGWLAASGLGLLASHVLYVECWRRWLAALGSPVSFHVAFTVLHQANLAKYLPGSGWHFVGRAALAARRGVPAEATAASLLLDVVVHVATAILFGVPALLVAGQPAIGPLAGGLVLAATAGGLALHPRLLGRALAVAARLLGRPPVAVPFGYPFMLRMGGLYVANWLVMGLAFAAFGQAWSAAPLTAAQGATLAGAIACAWALGAVAVFAPAGVGVRELGLAALLAPAFPPGWPALVALASRPWFMAAEAVAFAIATARPARD